MMLSLTPEKDNFLIFIAVTFASYSVDSGPRCVWPKMMQYDSWVQLPPRFYGERRTLYSYVISSIIRDCDAFLIVTDYAPKVTPDWLASLCS
jgi:hypothetical protein